MLHPSFFSRRLSRAAGKRTTPGGVDAFWGFCCALTLLLGSVLWTARPVAAQITVQPAIVLDFAVEPGLDPIYGRKAADALAVELQKSGDFEIVPRQTVEQAVASQPGLAPPYNAPTQSRLAQAVSARVVFSGRVSTAEVTNRRVARVTVEVRQLETITTDYVKGTTVSESTSELADVSSEVLIDQALNKASSTAVLRLKRSLPPSGTVLNTTVNDAEVNIGSRIGAAVGQRYSVLRDIYNKSKDRVERLKIGEVELTKVEMDQSVARVIGENQAGVRTGDTVRQIFVPTSYPVSPDGTAVSPRTSSSSSSGASRKSGGGGIGKSLGGILALGVLALVFGIGGGSSSNSPTGVQARSTSTIGQPAINVNFSAGAPKLFVPTRCIVGYFIYRGLNENSTLSASTPLDFQAGTATQYIDNASVFIDREVTIDAPNSTDPNNPCPAASISRNNSTALTTAPSSIVLSDPDSIEADFFHQPLFPGIQYFYRVRRVTVNRVQVATGNTITTSFELVLSDPSGSSGGATALVKPDILRAGGDFNSNVFVTLSGLTNIANVPPFSATNPNTVLAQRYVDDGIRFVFQFSNLTDFGDSITDPAVRARSVFETTEPVKQPEANGDLTFNFGSIVLPADVSTTEQIFVRVGVTNPSDQFPQTIRSDRFPFAFGSTSPLTLQSQAKKAVKGATPGTTQAKPQVAPPALPTAPPGRGGLIFRRRTTAPSSVR